MLILASASPRRQDLLRIAGIDFVTEPADVVETRLEGEPPRGCAERLAREKARKISHMHPGAIVLGADTIVVVDNQVLGKPADATDAARMLRLLSGRQHQVITGACLRGPGFEEVCAESTTVTMSELSEDEISFYVRTKEPMDKAGAYAIQGIASRWITRIEGDYCNVVGLPVAKVYAMLQHRNYIGPR